MMSLYQFAVALSASSRAPPPELRRISGVFVEIMICSMFGKCARCQTSTKADASQYSQHGRGDAHAAKITVKQTMEKTTDVSRINTRTHLSEAHSNASRRWHTLMAMHSRQRAATESLSRKRARAVSEF